MTKADETHQFTDLEFKVIFGVCRGLPNNEIAQQLGLAQDIVMYAMTNIFDKLHSATRFELAEFVKTALNSELRRRLKRRCSMNKLTVGHEVHITCSVYGCNGTVVKVSPDGVDVLVEAAKEDELLRAISKFSPEEQKEFIAQNKATLFRFDKDGNETDESCCDRGLGPDPTCGPWHLEVETETPEVASKESMTTADETFTPQELTVILALSLGMRHNDIEQHLGMNETIVQDCRTSICDKADLSNRVELFEFVRTALNEELRRRLSEASEGREDVGPKQT